MARLLIDLPNILWRSLSAGKDPEGFKATDPETGNETWVNTAGYGVENALQLLAAGLQRYKMAPKDCVFAMEGKNAKLMRQKKTGNLFEYKGARGKRPARAYSEYEKASSDLLQHFLELGSSFCVQDGAEADDVLAYLSKHSQEPSIVFTHDGDLTRLVGTNAKGVSISVGNNDTLNANPFGPFPNDLITLYKALVGDTSDSIPGAKGFGDKAFLELMAKYGLPWLYELEKLIENKTLFQLNPYTSECKLIARIVNNEGLIGASYQCAKLYPDVIDTAAALQWFFGMVRDSRPTDDQRYARWYGTRTLVHGGNFKKVIAAAKKQITDYIALDLETTTPEESDDWLAARSIRDSEERVAVDVYGSEIVSCGLTFGDNNQHSLYLTHRHSDADGIEQISLPDLGAALQYLTAGKRVVAHNAGGFELCVLRTHFEFDGDEEGFLPNVHCTKLLASYVNENISGGLKALAKHYLKYDQQTYSEVTQGRKMHQLTSTEALHYGTDDTVVTAALYNHLGLVCQTEGVWDTYQTVELDPMYLQAHAFLKGVPVSLKRMRELEEEDDKSYEQAWAVLRQFLIDKGWEGVNPPTYTVDLGAAQIKEAYRIVTGEDLDTKVRTPKRLVDLIEPLHPTFAKMLQRCLDGEAQDFTRYVQASFRGEPVLNLNSPKQVSQLMYETLALPVRERNELTDNMIMKGVTEGNPSTDELAIQMALHFDKGGAHPEVLKALLDLKKVGTRRKMYYGPYPAMPHWKDGGSNVVHASFNQCATVTRRYTCSGPNLQQLPKKEEGLKFREIILPHQRDAVVVSMDFSGQELRLMAEDSQDPAMLSCYVGDDLKDMHCLTASSISVDALGREVSYNALIKALEDKEDWAKSLRALGKKINFTVQYGALAPKVALTLMIEIDVAQRLLDARAALFKVSEAWKETYIKMVRTQGYATTRLGARRHLRQAFAADFRTASKAERQGPNFRIQGSGAEMVKLAMGRMWRRRIFQRYNAVPYGPIHDEYVASCAISDLERFVPEMHAAMVEPYAGMRVPIVSSISFGPSFGRQFEIGEEPSQEAIQKGLAQMREAQEQAA
jgi:DNA polymerase I-like protein with 3'-5' exonuclease and polymerase domains/5'-3' exonuclease